LLHHHHHHQPQILELHTPFAFETLAQAVVPEHNKPLVQLMM
jgi:hypothetical protein